VSGHFTTAAGYSAADRHTGGRRAFRRASCRGGRGGAAATRHRETTAQRHADAECRRAGGCSGRCVRSGGVDTERRCVDSGSCWRAECGPGRSRTTAGHDAGRRAARQPGGSGQCTGQSGGRRDASRRGANRSDTPRYAVRRRAGCRASCCAGRCASRG